MDVVAEKYKQTEVGLIPSDWEVKELRDVAEFASGTTPKREQHERYFHNGTTNWVKTLDLNNSELLDTQESVTDIALKETSSLKIFPIDTVLVAMYGGYNQIGRTGLLKINACVNQALTAIKTDRNILYPLFLINYLNFRVNFWKDIATSSRKDPNITSKDVKDFRIPIPTLAEQTAIATALSDTDALISSLEKLLDKKRNIKQGAMQQLLKPKEGWEMKRLGDIAEVVGGGTPSSFVSGYWNGTINWFTPTEIGKHKYTFESVRKITKEGFVNCSGKMLPIGTILLTTRAGIGDLSILMSEGCTNQGFQSLITREGYFNEYLYYLMHTLKNVLIQNASGSTFLEISPNKIKQIEILTPPFPEQTRIANILSDMDNEIAALETKLEKYKDIKQGMMQNLLTGKIRLL